MRKVDREQPKWGGHATGEEEDMEVKAVEVMEVEVAVVGVSRPLMG